jgi:hypothetical protein
MAQVTSTYQIDKKKSLGQYFTGNKLAKFLTTIAEADNQCDLIDPMCGNGDILNVYKNNLGYTCGIEIDKNAYSEALPRLSNRTNVRIVHGNCFDIKSIKKLPREQFDLVITNPPYVRYQTLNKNTDLPNSEEIRVNLKNQICLSDIISDTEKRLLLGITENYSGLSDLAVPSWILCSLLTKTGGTMALILPDSWLSRDYALIIRYLLLKLFRVKYIVIDSNASWFKPTQVKTNILIAEKINIDDSKFDSNYSYLEVQINSNACDNNSIVGNIFPKSNNPEKDFLNVMHDIKNGKSTRTKEGYFSVKLRSINSFKENTYSAISGYKWFKKLKDSYSQTSNSGNYVLPAALSELVNNSNVSFSTLEDLGIQVGQGLRTGANSFFYLTRHNANSTETLSSKEFGSIKLSSQNNEFLPVLRKQSELNGKYFISHKTLLGRLLYIKNKITSQDYGQLNTNKSKSIYSIVDTEVETYIQSAENKKYDNVKPIWQLSAVKTNTRKETLIQTPRFWYMLPELKDRHTPDLFVPRLNAGLVKTYLNVDRKSVIDANFSTIWLTSKAKLLNKFAALALFNSFWVTSILEYNSAILGGGALKVEATHLKRIPIPNLNTDDWNKLSILGEKLVTKGLINPDEIINSINEVIATHIFGKKAMRRKLEMVIKQRENCITLRTNKSL